MRDCCGGEGRNWREQLNIWRRRHSRPVDCTRSEQSVVVSEQDVQRENGFWKHEPRPSSHETTSCLCHFIYYITVQGVYVKLTLHRQPSVARALSVYCCACIYISLYSRASWQNYIVMETKKCPRVVGKSYWFSIYILVYYSYQLYIMSNWSVPNLYALRSVSMTLHADNNTPRHADKC